MQTRTTRKIKPTDLAADEAVIIAVKNLASYKPVAGMPTVEELLALNANVEAKEEAMMHAETVAMAARDATLGAQWQRREAVMRVKAQVIAQYGRDSDEVKAIGLKRQIDRKRATRRRARIS